MGGGVLGQCVGCELEGRKNAGFIGPRTAKLAIIGEYPGAEEVRKKEPFVGPSGRLLDLILQSCGIDRNGLRLGNVLLCGPVKEEDKSAAWFGECLSRCAVRREAEADLGEAKVVVTLGAHAAWGMLGERISLGGARPHRGAVHRDPRGRIIIPTWQPAAILKSGGAGDSYGKLSDADAETIGMDITKAWRLANGEIEEFKPTLQLEADPDRFADWCEWSIEHGSRVGIDVETDSAEPMTCKLLSVGLARRVQIDGGRVVVEAISFWWPNANDRALDALRRLLASEKIVSVLHNLQFDIAVLERLIGPVRGGMTDTMLLSHARFPDVEVKLDAVAHTWLAVHPWKHEHHARERERKQTREREYNAAKKKKAAAAVRRVEDENQGAFDFFGESPPPEEEPEPAAVAETEEEDEDAEDEDDLIRDRSVPWSEERVMDLLEYNALDSATTSAIEPLLVDECEREGVLHVAAIDVALAQTAWRMSENGVPIDQEMRQQLKKDTAARVEGSRARMWKIVEEGIRNPADQAAAERLEREIGKNAGQFNPNSPVMLECAFDVCGVKVPASKFSLTAKGKRSFGKRALAVIGDDPLVSSLSEYRGMTVQFSTYFGDDSMGLGPDKRLHVPWKIHGTPTGRWASGKEKDADDDVVSINLQNWPGAMRKMVIAPDGMRFVGADFAQLEYRVVALLAGEVSLLDLFNDPARPDLHNTNAARLFGVDWEATDPERVDNPFEKDRRKRKRKILRGLTKNGLYGAMYLGSAETIQKTLQARSLKETDSEFAEAMRRVSKKQCQDFVDAIPRLWPAIETWRKWAVQDAIANQQVVCPLSGRRRVWPLGMLDATQAVNSRVQTFAGSLMNERFLYLTTALPKEAKIILQVHDSVVVECPEEMAQDVLKIVTDTMTTDLTLGGRRCMFPVDAKIGRTWAEV